ARRDVVLLTALRFPAAPVPRGFPGSPAAAGLRYRFRLRPPGHSKEPDEAMKARTTVARAAALATPLAPPLSSHAIFRAYLSAGNAANPCTLQAPCRLLPAALAAVDDGGEIWMLDSANYNTAPVTIEKSVTILATPGAVGSVVSAGGSAITVSGDAARVTLRN